MTDKYDDLLMGWQEISKFIGTCIPTAIKYAKEQGLPVLLQGATPIAFKDEVRRWQRHFSKPYSKRKRYKYTAGKKPGRRWYRKEEKDE